MTYSQNEVLSYKYAGSQARDRRQLLALGDGLKLVVGRASARSLVTVELPLLALLALIITVAAMIPPGRELGLLDGDISQIVFCPFYLLTDIPCLFCGITRSFLAMGHWQLSQAFIFHPLGPLFFLSLVALAVLLVFSLAGRRQFRIEVEAKLRSKLLVASVAVLLAAWLVKLVVWSQVGLLEFWL